MRDWVATFAIQQGFRRVETGVPAEFQAIKDGGGITWRYPLPNSVSSDLHGGIEIWNGGDPKEFRDMVALMDRQISKLGRVVRIVLVVDPRTHNCGDACRVELAHPVDLSRFEELVQPRR